MVGTFGGRYRILKGWNKIFHVLTIRDVLVCLCTETTDESSYISLRFGLSPLDVPENTPTLVK